MSKPTWNTAPQWANWLALDEDGQWYWYASKPEWIETFWGASGAVHKHAGDEPLNSQIEAGWSLEPKPGILQDVVRILRANSS